MITEQYIEEILNPGLGAIQYNEPYKSNFISLYKSLYGIATCSSCPQDIYYAYHELKKTYKQKLNQMATQKWTITPGVILDSYGLEDGSVPAGHYTSANITDEIAIKLKKAGIGKKHIIPFNAPEDNNLENDAVDVESVKDYTVAELQSFAKDANLPDADWKNLKKKELTEYALVNNLI